MLRRMPDTGQMATRSKLSWLVISFHPPFSSPDQVGGRDPHVLVEGGAGELAGHGGSGVQLNPGASTGTMNTDRPLCLGTSGSVRAASHT